MRAAGVNQLLAPITTFNADGTDNLHGWMLQRGSREPEKVQIVIEDELDRVDEQLRSATEIHPENHDADLIDTLILRRRACLDHPHLRLWDRWLARRLYSKVVAQAFADPSQCSSKSSFWRLGDTAKGERA